MRNMIDFHLMKLMFKIRDLFNPPLKILENLGISPGQYVLDYGCGPGSWTFAASKLVHNNGKIYAADINPHAIKNIMKIGAKKGLTNIETILTDCSTGLEKRSIDIVILFDIYHDLENADKVLEELHRVMKHDSTLFFSDHHLTKDKIMNSLPIQRLFSLVTEEKGIYQFTKS